MLMMLYILLLTSNWKLDKYSRKAERKNMLRNAVSFFSMIGIHDAMVFCIVTLYKSTVHILERSNSIMRKLHSLSHWRVVFIVDLYMLNTWHRQQDRFNCLDQVFFLFTSLPIIHFS